ncbi:MAG: ParB/RepB/Spo0J family partition protein [Firmicutes bacterium]|nr:ParB/RepB/Spo0J family partition protein [Bacillota bacterium]
MAKKKSLEIPLASIDDLFSTQQQREDNGREKIVDLSLDEISDFPNHPFHVSMDNEMERLVESIKQNGVLVPALVRPKESGGYEMIAGHRRKFASGLAGREEIPCIVRTLSDDESTIIMVDSNMQRENLLPSEKAFAFKMKLEAMKRQGMRTDLTSCQVGTKLSSAEKLGSETQESARQVYRYVRLTYLIPELLKRVDEGKMAMNPAVEISYIPKELQEELLNAMEMEDCTPSYAQAKKMRKFLDMDKLSGDSILAIMQEEKPNQKEKIVLREERISKFIPPNIPLKGREEYIIKALEYYAKVQEKQRQTQTLTR